MLLLLWACVRTTPDLGPVSGPGAVALPETTAAALTQAWHDRPDDYVPRTRHLREDGTPAYTNRLFLETSPYLRQHAHNPVDWCPWGDEAFALAAQLGRPVLLSVGYATCHWCHVMEEESFEDPEIAQFINEHYVAIKVDREERPDVDAVYMAAVQALNGRGGWPMTVWLTADREPFQARTYLPARDGDRGRSTGFLTLLRQLHEVHRDQPDRIVAGAGELSRHLEARLAPTPVGAPPGMADLDRLTSASLQRYDPVNGGTQGQPKFPSSLPIRFLLRRGPEARQAALHSLHAMADGGIHDQLGGGFHRYATDDAWRVPHFEKMLYDNALLTIAYLEGIPADPTLAAVARRTLDYLQDEVMTPQGTFTSATDADSLVPGTDRREEGWFFTWTPDEISAILDADRASLAQQAWGITAPGNLDGRSVLYRPHDDAALALALGRPVDEIAAQLRSAQGDLLAARSQRPPPLRDTKVITGWNGLAISAFARGAVALDDPALAKIAEAAAGEILRVLRIDGRLMRSHAEGRARHAAVLEDYSFLAAGLVDLFEATGQARWLTEAIALDRVIEDHFSDGTGGWYRTADDAEVLLARERPNRDGAIPGGASVHTLTLLRLAALTAADPYRQRATAALSSYRLPIVNGAMAEMLLAVQWHVDGAKEVIVVTPTDNPSSAQTLLDEIRQERPFRRVLVVVPEAEVDALAEQIPPVSGKIARDGVATAYVCEGGVCALPTSDPQVLRGLLAPTEPRRSE